MKKLKKGIVEVANQVGFYQAWFNEFFKTMIIIIFLFGTAGVGVAIIFVSTNFVYSLFGWVGGAICALFSFTLVMKLLLDLYLRVGDWFI